MNYTSNMGMNMPDENDKFSIEHFNTNTQTLDIVGKPDEYKNTKTYAVGDLCIHNNILYKCITAVETAEEFNAEKWEVTSLCKEEVANKTAIAELNENSNWKQLLLAENIPATFTQYDVQWNECKELIFVLGFYGNVLETIVEPVSLFATHNGEGNRIIFGASDEVEIYASLPTSNDSMFIKNGGRSTNVLRIYGR